MILEDLVARADELRARFKVLEKIKGSGHHDDDRNLVHPELFLAPQKNGFSKASEQPVFFIDYDDELVRFAGDDAEKILTILQTWRELNQNRDMSVGTTRKMVTKIIPRLKVKDGLLTINLSTWNDVLYVLEEEKVAVLGRPFVEDGSPLPGE